MSVRQENRWRATLSRIGSERNDLIRQIEAAHLKRIARPAAAPPRLKRASRLSVRRWMRGNAMDYEFATTLAEAANVIFELPGAGLDDETHWVWDEAADALDWARTGAQS